MILTFWYSLYRFYEIESEIEPTKTNIGGQQKVYLYDVDFLVQPVQNTTMTHGKRRPIFKSF